MYEVIVVGCALLALISLASSLGGNLNFSILNKVDLHQTAT